MPVLTAREYLKETSSKPVILFVMACFFISLLLFVVSGPCSQTRNLLTCHAGIIIVVVMFLVVFLYFTF
ncbi:hypothetical protein L596_000379 [Steinernema carpocapsae]|uniref:Uncharacterized protein n=1 Tax=Steinernema carpocapsae TaxID=34508 RepID=A0A4U8UI68_STECR|nr:hypothetical protein L596_000379 [Steinernema carpocapsae]